MSLLKKAAILIVLLAALILPISASGDMSGSSMSGGSGVESCMIDPLTGERFCLGTSGEVGLTGDVPVPGLAPGSLTESTITITTSGGYSGGYSGGHYPGGAGPQSTRYGPMYGPQTYVNPLPLGRSSAVTASPPAVSNPISANSAARDFIERSHKTATGAIMQKWEEHIPKGPPAWTIENSGTTADYPGRVRDMGNILY